MIWCARTKVWSLQPFWDRFGACKRIRVHVHVSVQRWLAVVSRLALFRPDPVCGACCSCCSGPLAVVFDHTHGMPMVPRDA